MPDLGEGLVYYIVFLLSTTLHEASHALVAMEGGDLTAYHGGQVSINPIPHIKRAPFGMVVLPILSVVTTGWPFGFASAPYDRAWAVRYPRRAALMALGGPAANLLLVLLSAACIRIGTANGVFYAPSSIKFGHIVASDATGLWPAVGFFLGVVFSLNLLLAAFNLLPVPPLDGSGVPPLFLHDRWARRYQEFVWGTPAFGLMGIIVAWQVFDYIFHPLFLLAVNLLYPGTTYG